MATDIVDIEDFRARIGTKLGVSKWVAIDQEQITNFGVNTDDMDPMHVDPEWSARSSPYRTTIAFGFLTMSLITSLYHDVFSSIARDGGGKPVYGINYGFDRVRLIEPVPVNSRIRGHFSVMDVIDRSSNESIVKLKVEVEVEGIPRMAMVAEWLTLLVDEEGSDRIAVRRQNTT